MTTKIKVSQVSSNNFKGSLSGNAASATAFSTPKAVTLKGAVNGTFSSTAGWSIPTIWRGCIVGQSSSNELNPWYKVASITLTNPNYDSRITFLVENTCSGIAVGTLHVHIRTDENKKVISTDTGLVWLFNRNFIPEDFVLICPTFVSPTCELWTKIDTGYLHRSFTVLSEGNRTISKVEWSLFNTSSEGSYDTYPTTGIHFISK